jgi:UDP-glucuronate 4-epimerase
MTVLVTGAAGFIGAAVAEQLLARGEQVVGVDSLNSYYDPALKRARLERLQAQTARAPSRWRFHQLDIADGAAMAELFAAVRPGLIQSFSKHRAGVAAAPLPAAP